jgi:hypothetical protein
MEAVTMYRELTDKEVEVGHCLVDALARLVLGSDDYLIFRTVTKEGREKGEPYHLLRALALLARDAEWSGR